MLNNVMESSLNEERIKCGEVYTWNCNGELYAVECHLCEEKPLCTLKEYADHMEIWHQNWQNKVWNNENRKKNEFEIDRDVNLNANGETYLPEIRYEIGGINNENESSFEKLIENVLNDEDNEDQVNSREETLLKDDVEAEQYYDNLSTNQIKKCNETFRNYQNFEQVIITPTKKLLSQNELKDNEANEIEKIIKKQDLTLTIINNNNKSDRNHPNSHDGLEKSFINFHIKHNKKETLITTIEAKSNLTTKATTPTISTITIPPSNGFTETAIVSQLQQKDQQLNLSKNEQQPYAQQQHQSEPTSQVEQLQQQKHHVNNKSISTKSFSNDEIEHLIELYKQYPCLWNQSNPEFRDIFLTRHSWAELTKSWNIYCNKNYSITDVRIQISNLCQRYMSEHKRLEYCDDLDSRSKFIYYEKMKFLNEQRKMQERRHCFENQNSKIISVYKKYPILWNKSHDYLKIPFNRHEVLQNIQKSLQEYDIHLTTNVINRRILSLRKCYRVEKIRFLQCQMEQTEFIPKFKHYSEMLFLNNHIDPFVCNVCGKIFEHLNYYKEHISEENHGDYNEADTDESLSSNDDNYYKYDDEFIHDNGNDGDDITTDSLVDEEWLVDEEDSEDGYLDYTDDFEENEEIDSIQTLDFLTNESQISTLTSFPKTVTTPHNNLPEEPKEYRQPRSLSSKIDLEDALVAEIMAEVEKELQESFHDSISNITMEKNHKIEKLKDSKDFEMHNNRRIERLKNIKNKKTPPRHLSQTNLNQFQSSTFSKQSQETESLCSTQSKESAYSSYEEISHSSLLLEKTILTAPDSSKTEIKTNSHSGSKHKTKETEISVNKCYKLRNRSLTKDEETDETWFDDDEEQQDKKSSKTCSRLTVKQTHFLIALYKEQPILWNPNHLDYHSRIERRKVWCELTAKMNKQFNVHYSWHTLHRKMTDSIKYYKREKQRLDNMSETHSRWCFFSKFTFLDDVLLLSSELQKPLQQKDINLLIIDIYKSYPQLWDTSHPEYTKRSTRHRYLDALHSQLQAENITITPERLRNRIIELRYNYRLDKEKRLEAEKLSQSYISNFEYRDALNFLEPHVSPFQCDLCSIFCKTLKSFATHKHKAHGIAKKVNKRDFKQSSEETGTILRNVCHICGLSFTLRNNLNLHLQRHRNERKFNCSFCSKKFFTSSSLKIHERSHTKELPYQCDKCGRGFTNTSKLNEHLKRHSGERNFPCDKCDKQFFTSFERERHMRHHLKIRDKVCPVCGKTFVMSSAYYTHMDLHRAEKRYTCEFCGLKFAQYSGLYKHRKRHHQS